MTFGNPKTAAMFVTLDGITLHYRREGQAGRPALLFVNSLGTDLRIWDAVVPAFANRFGILRHDSRGHGLTDGPNGPYTIADLADDLERLVDHLKLETLIPIGISIGGMVALELSVRRARQTAALVLCDTGARIGTTETWDERIRTVREHGLEAIGEMVLDRWFTPAFASERPAERRGFYHMLTRTPSAGYAATCQGLRDADLTDSARRVTARTLVLGGVEDMATPPELMRRLAQSIPGASLRLIEGAAHLPCLEKPKETAAAISEFLTDQGYG